MAEVDGGDIIIRIRGDASELEAEIDKAQGALGELEAGADDTSGSLGSMAGAAGNAGKAMQGLSRGGINGVAMGLSAINPAAGKLVRTLGYLRYVTGPLAVAMVAAAAAVKLYTDEQERQNRVAERNASISEALAASNTRLQASLEDLAVATGDLTAEELKLLRARRQVFTESLPSLQETTQAILEEENRVRQLTARIAELEEQQSNGAAMAGEFAGSITASATATIRLDAELRKARNSLAESTGMIETQTAAREQMLENIKRQVEAQRLLIEEEIKQATAREASAEGARAQARAIREIAQAEAALQRQRDNQRKKEQADQAAADQEQAEKEEKKRSKQDADAKAAAKQQEAIEQGIRDSISATADLSMTLSGVVAEKNVKAARKLHRVSQAASLTQVAMNTSVAITKALAELGPIAGAVASVGIGLTGAAQAAAIAAQPAPTAHIGTGMPGSRDPLAPDERMSNGRRVLTTEASGPGGVANSMGTQLLNDVNTGRVQSSGRITAVIGRSHLDQELFRSGRRGTSRYARSLRTNPHPKPQGGY